MDRLERQRSQENIARLAEVHIQRYGNRLALARAGRPGYRAPELQGLMSLWHGVVAKGCRWEALTEDEQLEVADAIEDDDFD